LVAVIPIPGNKKAKKANIEKKNHLNLLNIYAYFEAAIF